MVFVGSRRHPLWCIIDTPGSLLHVTDPSELRRDFSVHNTSIVHVALVRGADRAATPPSFKCESPNLKRVISSRNPR